MIYLGQRKLGTDASFFMDVDNDERIFESGVKVHLITRWSDAVWLIILTTNHVCTVSRPLLYTHYNKTAGIVESQSAKQHRSRTDIKPASRLCTYSNLEAPLWSTSLLKIPIGSPETSLKPFMSLLGILSIFEPRPCSCPKRPWHLQ